MSIDAPMTGDLPLDASEPDARAALAAFAALFGTPRPSLRQVWAAMDFVWDAIGADNRNPSPEHLSRFYSHPVWLLNGLFIEQHAESLNNRRGFTDWIASVRPRRVADFGGGYGTLARMVGAALPDASVEIVDPFPRPEAVRANAGHPNVTFADALSGEYDVIVATDVFEHVEDPVGLFLDVAQHIPVGGHALIANHFAPSIKCHLPRTFHLAATWDAVMALAGFERAASAPYGGAWRRAAPPRPERLIRRVEALSRTTYGPSRVVRGGGRVRRLVIRALTAAVAPR